MYKKRAPQLRLRSIFTLKSAPQLRFLYIVRLMSHKTMGFAPRCDLRLRRAFLNQGRVLVIPVSFPQQLLMVRLKKCIYIKFVI
ncbi:hypothetical protein Hanom_Chr17g01575241 [Helianthus anomalus]